VFSGLTMIIPFFGPIIATIPVLAVALLGAPDVFIWVLGLTIVLQQLVLNVIGPRIMSNAIGIHPIFVFLALLLGSRIGGFWGVVLAMPVAGVINTFVRYAFQVAQGRRARTEASTLIDESDAAHAAAAADLRDAEAETKEAQRLAQKTRLAARGKQG
jgi:predicted PurR-regulated permease PerM